MSTSVIAVTLTKAVIILLCMSTSTLGQPPKQAKSPIKSNQPFITVWNAPTATCQSLFGVELNLGMFDIIANQNESFIGQNVTIFYSDKLGSYPYYTENGVSVNGGVPQNASLKDHLAKAQVDVDKLIPLKDFGGLSVIDWEAWRPSWIRDWDQKAIYREKSKELVRRRHPDWSESQVAKQAQNEYEQAASDFMGQTLKMAKGLRPWGLWGYYGFPCCYNNVISKNYTGECPDIEMKRNDHLMWLWRESIALYPSIYLDVRLQSTENAHKFVHYRIKESLRLAQLGANYSLPVLPYARIVYANTTDFLTEIDLVHTIGESVAMGAAGIVLWGNSDYAHSQACLPLVDHRVLAAVVMSKTWVSPPTRADGRCAEPGTGKMEREKIVTEELRAVPLHHCPEFVEACANLINEEWKRSKASRIHSLQKSSNCFPVCLVLIRTLKNIDNPRNETKGQLVGHSRLSHVVGKPTALFVETVVIAKEFRGKGYGRKLMEATEVYAKLRGFKTLYLTTHDKQHFYSHLGYILSEPVQNAGSMTTFVHMEFLERLSVSSTMQPSCNSSHFESSGTVLGCSSVVCSDTAPDPTSPNSSSAHLCLQSLLPTPNPPPISPPFNFHSKLHHRQSPRVPSSDTSTSLQISAPPISASAQIYRLNPPPPSHPIPSSQSNESITSPSTSLVTLSSQPGQHQPSVSCFSTTPELNALNACIPIPPPPPPPPPLPASPFLFSSQLQGHSLPCNSSSLSLVRPSSHPSRLHSPLALPLQLSSPPADSMTMLLTPPPWSDASETLSQLSQFPCHSDVPGDKHKLFKEEGDATQSQLETPYRDVKGLPVFWMKKDM